MSIALAGFRGQLNWLLDFEDRFFTTRKMRNYGLALLVAHVIALGVTVVNGQWLIRPDGKLKCIDFAWIWLSGKFAASSNPVRAYDYGTFAAAQLDLFGAPGNCIILYHFEYPPVLLFFSYPLGLMPYVIAFAFWNVVLLVLYLGVVYATVGRTNAVIGALTPMAAARDLQLGHNGLLTAGLIGLPLVLLERKPLLAGVFLGLLTYKPQFGLLFPIAFLASRNWRALTGATLSTLALAVAASLAFGIQAWPSFFSALTHLNTGLSPEASLGLGLQSIFGLLQSAGLSVQEAAAVHATVAVMIAVAVWIVWSNPIPHALRAATLCVGCLVVNPYLLQYDFCVLTIAAAFLISDGLFRGFLVWERSVIAFGWVALIWLDAFRLGPMIFCAILLWMIFRRVALLKVACTPGSEAVLAPAIIVQIPN
jgi:hypothetical protein